MQSPKRSSTDREEGAEEGWEEKKKTSSISSLAADRRGKKYEKGKWTSSSSLLSSLRSSCSRSLDTRVAASLSREGGREGKREKKWSPCRDRLDLHSMFVILVVSARAGVRGEGERGGKRGRRKRKGVPPRALVLFAFDSDLHEREDNKKRRAGEEKQKAPLDPFSTPP